jgi:predicted metal-dependent HD superfamily phosphohydrolase
MTPLDRFRGAWKHLASRLGLNEVATAVVDHYLVEQYTSAGRHYHGVGHVVHLLDEAGSQAALYRDGEAVGLAVFFHDAVYDPARDDNEAQSAAALRQLLAGAVADPTLARVEAMILATRRHEATGDQGIDAFLDADLSILAARWDDYARYADGVRREYAPLVGEEAFRKGRLDLFLRPTLGRGRVFLTDAYAPREAAALANLRREAEILASGGLVGPPG